MNQAEGGVGSMLNDAQNKLSPDQFDEAPAASGGASAERVVPVATA